MPAKPTPNQSIFLRWRKPLDALIAGRYMKLGATKASPTITVWRTVKSAGNRWTQGTAQAFVTTNPSRCQMARMFERDRALLARAMVLLHNLHLAAGLARRQDRRGRSQLGLVTCHGEARRLAPRGSLHAERSIVGPLSPQRTSDSCGPAREESRARCRSPI